MIAVRKVGRSGFTLVELLVALAIVAIVASSIVRMFTTMAVGHTVRGSRADLQQSVRAVMELMSREIRMAGFSSIGPMRFGIEKAAGDELSFTVDWDDDGSVTESHADDDLTFQESDIISYRFDRDAGSLVRVTAEGTASRSSQSLVGGAEDLMRVIDLSFIYFDRNDRPTSRIVDISSIGVALTAELPAGMKGRVARVYEARIRCRNLGL